jgi:hypothetical protein
LPGEALIETVGLTVEFTAIVRLLLVAVCGLAQAALPVITQVITSPFKSVLSV